MKAYYDPLTDTIHGCKENTFVWFHECGHRRQFQHQWVKEWDFKLWRYPILYFFWNQLLEIDANLYACVQWCKFIFINKPQLI